VFRELGWDTGNLGWRVGRNPTSSLSNFVVFGLCLVVGPSMFYHFDFSPLSSLGFHFR
jgi:hypothetical protein